MEREELGRTEVVDAETVVGCRCVTVAGRRVGHVESATEAEKGRETLNGLHFVLRYYILHDIVRWSAKFTLIALRKISQVTILGAIYVRVASSL